MQLTPLVGGENEFAAVPTAAYGVVLLLAAIAYWLLQLLILRNEGPDSLLARAVGRDWKGKASPIIYTIAILSTLIHPWIAGVLYVLVALTWLIPDRRIEQVVTRTERQ
ncbi:MAG: TMEM175 family protein [Longimicrobiales bacterium]